MRPARASEGARSQAKGVVVHSERVHVFAKKGVATAECFSSYMPSLDDVRAAILLCTPSTYLNRGGG